MIKEIKVDKHIKCKISELIESPVVIKVNNFNDDAVKDFQDQYEKCLLSGQPIVPVLIDSYGGQVYSLLAMMAIIKNSSLPVITVVQGKAMSCGAILFGMGSQRYMAENSTLMLHDVSSLSFGKVEEIKSDAKECERLNNLIFSQLAKNCGQSSDYFNNIIHTKGRADWYLDIKEAKKHKICTHVGVPKLEVKVSVNYQIK